MGLTVSLNERSGDFEQTPSGSFIARCYGVVDLGTQKITFQGETKEKHQVRLMFEILDEPRMKDGRPFTIGQNYTVSLDPKASLRKMLDTWRGKPFTEAELKKFELSNIVGAYAQITVSHTPSKDGTKVYADLVGVSPLHKSITPPAPVNPNVVFDMDAPNANEVFESLPKWLQGKIEESKEWATPQITRTPEPTYLSEPSDGPIPF